MERVHELSPAAATPEAALDLAAIQRRTLRLLFGTQIISGVGVAVGFKNLMYSEGFEDDSEARVRMTDGAAWVRCAVAEVGQGFVTIAGQIARSMLRGGARPKGLLIALGLLR